MKTIPTVLAGLVLVPALAAQTSSFTSPRGLANQEGNTWFFAETNRTYQAIDATNLGSVAILQSFALRRDKSNPNASRAGASTVDATLTLGEQDMAVVYSDPLRNYGSRKTVVFPKKRVNWPDWRLPSPTPAPFDFRIPFASVFVYFGFESLVWGLTLENGTNTGNVFDRDHTLALAGAAANLSFGCGAFSHESGMESNGPAMQRYGMRLKAAVSGAPPGAPISLSVALRDANARIPGWCARLHAIPDLSLPLGVADTAGRVYPCYFNTAYDAALNGVQLYTQAFTISGGNIALSNGRRSTMPTATNTAGHEAAYLWLPVNGPPHVGVFHGGSIVARFGN